MGRHIKKKKLIYIFSVIVIMVIAFFAAWPAQKVYKSKSNPSQAASSIKTAPPSFNKSLYSTDEASSLWAVVNKGRSLPSTYVPANLTTPNVPLRLSASDPEMHVRADTAAAMEKMFAAAGQEGINLMLASGYRSYTEQITVYNGYARSSGVAQADTFSARPGHSEHQTGLAADIEPTSRNCEVDQCFETTPEGKWLAANCYKYGFIIRYQKDTQNLTGYEYEPWHVRYLGNDLADQIYQAGQTLEQFFDLPIYTSYPEQGLTLSG
jgi:zinc D-Ala-D-Ala carboxypeptidase